MKNLAQEIKATKVPEGSAAIWWLAQAGFAFKSSDGTVIYLDPYLSNVVEKLAGFVRLCVAPIDIQDVQADWLVSSHEHPDHLDTDALPIIAQNNLGCRFAGSADCAPEYDKCGIPSDRVLIMEAGKDYKLGGIDFRTARADHGEYSPSALALLLDFGKVKIMFTGDTCLNMDFLQPLIDMKPDIILPCINGSFGNLNAEEAAQLTSAAGARAAIPCHFWMFKEHHVVEHGDPHTFFEACGRLCPGVDIQLLSPGQGIVVGPDKIQAIEQ
ncbi:MAG: MBL fold metallo-hydrolase [Armatimonadota bacterium]